MAFGVARGPRCGSPSPSLMVVVFLEESAVADE
jgi:hypothetical protein